MLAVVGVIPYVVQAEDKEVIQHGGFEVVDRYQTVVESHPKDQGIPKRPLYQFKYEHETFGPKSRPEATWKRGRCGFRNISHYIHYSKQGHASCENGDGVYDEGDWADPYKWSEAEVTWTWTGGNKAWYGYRDANYGKN